MKSMRILQRDPAITGTLGAADLRRLPDAARDENAAAIGLLLDAGWPIDARGQHGATALHWAAFHGNTAMVRDLLRRTPPLEVRDNDFDGTPLFWADLRFGSRLALSNRRLRGRRRDLARRGRDTASGDRRPACQ